MSITEFVGLFDKNKVAEGKIRFTFLPPKSWPCKFGCEDGEDVDALIKHIQESPVKEYEIIGAEEISVGYRWGITNVMVKLVFQKEGSE